MYDSLFCYQNPTQEKLYDPRQKQHIILTPKNHMTLAENSLLCQLKKPLTLSRRHSQKSFVIDVRLVNLLVKCVRQKSHTVHL